MQSQHSVYKAVKFTIYSHKFLLLTAVLVNLSSYNTFVSLWSLCVLSNNVQ